MVQDWGEPMRTREVGVNEFGNQSLRSFWQSVSKGDSRERVSVCSQSSSIRRPLDSIAVHF